MEGGDGHVTFAELKTAFLARGFDYLETRAGDFINSAMHELDDTERWPYLEDSAVGQAPLAIPNLGTVEQVINTSQSNSSLYPADYGELVGMFGDLSANGTPYYFYVAWPSGVPTVATYPGSTNTIGVQYWRVTEDLAADADEPAAPARFHKLIVDIAVRDAYRDTDNHPAAESLQVQIERDLARMRNSLLTGQVQGPSFVRIVAGSEDS